MEVAHLILALGADMSGQMHLLNCGFDSLKFDIPKEDFPATMGLPIYVAGKLLFENKETGKTYGTSVDIVAPDGRVVASISKDIDVQPANDAERPVSHSGLVTFSALSFPTPGLYKVRQLVNGKPEKVIPLFIEAAPDSSMEKPHASD